MLLIELCEGLVEDTSSQKFNNEVLGLTEDSRDVGPGYVYAAVKGNNFDGADFIDEAVEAGAIAVIASRDFQIDDENVLFIKHDNPRKLLGMMASCIYSKRPKMISAVTGTNGKTSVVYFAKQIWEALGSKAATVGTIGVSDTDNNSYNLNGSMTTPGVVDFNKLISEISSNANDYIAVEASSHGLDQYRLSGVEPQIAAFTNFSRDHLDYHESMDEYFNSKMLLFSEFMRSGGKVVLNSDIDEYPKISEICLEHNHEIIDYGKSAKQLKIASVESNYDGLTIDLEALGSKKEIQVSLFGEFQAYNIICALGMVLASGFELEECLNAIKSIEAADGRMQKIENSGVFVDYAHTPDALEKAIISLRGHVDEGSRVNVVFGCGGDRDKGKRPIMGRIASKYADKVIITDDNPRSEDPAEIRRDIFKGVESDSFLEIADRRDAIKGGIESLEKGDVLLIAGKGHETGQIIGDNVENFNDYEVSKEILGEL